jgi:hypothetical protein
LSTYPIDSAELSEEDARGHIDAVSNKDANVPEVSCLAETDPTAAATVTTTPTLTKSEIAALVATRLWRYLQMMVWDIYVDVMEYLTKPPLRLIFLNLATAMILTEETSFDLEIELLIE